MPRGTECFPTCTPKEAESFTLCTIAAGVAYCASASAGALVAGFKAAGASGLLRSWVASGLDRQAGGCPLNYDKCCEGRMASWRCCPMSTIKQSMDGR